MLKIGFFEQLIPLRFNLFVYSLFAALFLLSQSPALKAEPFNLGPKKCQECHKAEAKVWAGTAHAKSYKKIHKSKKAKKIVKAVGGKRMKKEALCANCHYTVARKSATKKAKLVAGPSCESCHGPASEWIKIHNNKIYFFKVIFF